MSIPSKKTTWGTLLYNGIEFGVLYTSISEELIAQIKQINKEKNFLSYTSAPWMRKKKWCIEDGKLYLTELYSQEFHKAVFGSTEKVFAYWVNKMKLLIEHHLICKTYQRRNSYLNSITTETLLFQNGNFIGRKQDTELYISHELRQYIDRNEGYATLRIDSIDLFHYLDNDTKPEYDDIFPSVSNFISQITQNNNKDDIPINIEDIKKNLQKGDLAVFASAKVNVNANKSDIEEIIGSLIISMTDEVLTAKECFVHLTIYKDYPLNNIEKIMSNFEKQLKLDSDTTIIFGIHLSNNINRSGVLIRVLSII